MFLFISMPLVDSMSLVDTMPLLSSTSLFTRILGRECLLYNIVHLPEKYYLSRLGACVVAAIGNRYNKSHANLCRMRSDQGKIPENRSCDTMLTPAHLEPQSRRDGFDSGILLPQISGLTEELVLISYESPSP